MEVEVLGEDDRDEGVELLLLDLDPFVQLSLGYAHPSLGELVLEQGQLVLGSESIELLLACLQLGLELDLPREGLEQLLCLWIVGELRRSLQANRLSLWLRSFGIGRNVSGRRAFSILVLQIILDAVFGKPLLEALNIKD